MLVLYKRFGDKMTPLLFSQTLRGGDGMTGFAVRDPTGQLVHPYQWKKQSEYETTSETGGYFTSCIDNQFSRFAGKLVNMYLTTFR